MTLEEIAAEARRLALADAQDLRRRAEAEDADYEAFAKHWEAIVVENALALLDAARSVAPKRGKRGP